ncbi:MAG: EamA family transporter [Patulibacter minatonensis]
MAVRVNPVWLVLLAILSVQLGAGMAKRLFDEVDPTTVVWLRLAVSAVLITMWARPALRGRSRTDWLVACAFGLSLAVMNWSLYQSLSRIPLGLAVTIEFIGPLSLAVAGSRRPIDLLWVALAAGGVGLLGLEGGGLDVVGVLFALLAGAAWASYILLSGQTGRCWAGLDGLAVASVVGAVLVSPLLLGGHAGELASTHVIATGVLVGLLSSVVPYAAEIVALRRLAPSVFAILMSLEPAAAALVGMVVVLETLAPREWLAIGCVVSASIGATRARRVLDEPAPV